MRASICGLINGLVLMSLTLPAWAWSHGTPQPPSYYVDASAGNDANAGTQAAPWQTLHKINTTVFPIIGTTINFQGSFSGGDNGLNFTTTNAPNGHIIVQPFGTGATISSGNSTAGYVSTNLPGMQIGAIAFVGGGNATNTTAGVSISAGINGQLAGPTLNGTGVSGYGSDGVVIFSSVDHGGFANVSVTNGNFHDNTGNDTTHLTACLRIIGGGSFDGYPNYNVTFQGNLIQNCNGNASNNQGGGSGIYYADTLTALVQDNFVKNFGANDTNCGGPVGIWTYNSNGGVIRGNEITGGSVGSGGCDGGGIDLDLGTINTIVEYNYPHGNINYGINLCGCSASGTWSNNIVRDNFTEANNVGGSQAEIYFQSQTAALTNAQVYNNTMYGLICLGFAGTAGATGFAKNNLCIGSSSSSNLVAGATGTGGSVALDHNDYTGSTHFQWAGSSYSTFAAYQSGASQDANSITTAPTLNGTAGTGGTCYTSGTPAGPQPCPTVYELKTTSSAQIGVGVSISSPGSQDYYGNTIPNGSGTGYNIGAYGGTGVP